MPQKPRDGADIGPIQGDVPEVEPSPPDPTMDENAGASAPNSCPLSNPNPLPPSKALLPNGEVPNPLDAEVGPRDPSVSWTTPVADAAAGALDPPADAKKPLIG